jgi:hypothetical protein
MTAAQMAVAPAGLLRTTLYHVGGAMPQLKSWNRNGPTLYALTVVGAKRGSWGGASLVGPALNKRGLTDIWPLAARGVGEELFAKPPARRAGQVSVVVIVQSGNVSHCSMIVIPAMPRPLHEAPDLSVDGPNATPRAGRMYRSAV